MTYDTAGRLLSAWPSALRDLKRRGFQPRTIFDIGVADGTPDLYAAFPHAEYYLVDPTAESLPHMQRIAQRLNAEIFNIALGELNTESVIGVRPRDIGGSTFFEEVGQIDEVKRYSVPVRRFDSVATSFERPALCKIDVQGAELSVLRGMGQRIHDLDVIIVETSVIATVADGPEIFDIIAYLKQQGFVPYDMLGSSRRPLDNALAQLDLMFVKSDSDFRADRRWSAARQ
jgi:FkbM family methyltransferase